jgi:hypothetical protein
LALKWIIDFKEALLLRKWRSAHGIRHTVKGKGIKAEKLERYNKIAWNAL